MHRARGHLRVVGAFALLTLAMTYPLALGIGSAVHGLGDPLLNAWILAWETRALFEPGSHGFFDTNIFYPHRNTLAYSEMLIPQLVVAAPFIRISGNPILGHNVVLLLSMLATATGAYLLAWQRTREYLASFIAGLIFAFCPFMFDHLAQVQILFAAGIPLAFFFLQRFLDRQRTLDAVLLALVYAAQVLANTYYAVYLTWFLGFYALFHSVRLWRRPRFWRQGLLIAGLAAALILPFYAHYFQLRAEMDFARQLPPPIPLSSYLAAPAANHLYGDLTASLGRAEARLFPGIVPTALALLGLWTHWRRPGDASSIPSRAPSASPMGRWSGRILDGSLLALAALLLLMAFGFTLDWQLGPIRWTLRSMRNPVILLLSLLVIRQVCRRRWPSSFGDLPLRFQRPSYPIILLAALVLSLGRAPYPLLHRFLPGFDSLRAVPRIHVMFIFALAVLAAEGAAFLLRRLEGSQKRLAMVVLPLLILLEYVSAPLPMKSAPRSKSFSAAHHWLAEHEENLVFATYPNKISTNILNLYSSTLHWHETVNGFSGFIPPLYEELAARGRLIPRPQSLRDLRSLGVDYVLVDTDQLRRGNRRRLQETMTATPALELLTSLDGTQIFRLAPPEPTLERLPSTPRPLVPLAASRLSLTASANTPDLDQAVDGDASSRWQVPMRPDQWLTVGWGEREIVSALEIELSGVSRGYPRGYRIEASEDGFNWKTVAERPRFYPPIRDFLDPADFRIRLHWFPEPARFLRLVQTGSDDRVPWSVSELTILAEPLDSRTRK